jgi:hypothetical protein
MNRALLSALTLCFAAVGCDSQKAAEPPKPKTAAVVPLPPEAPTAAAASANQDAKTMPVAGVQKAGAPAAGKKRPGTKGCGNGKCVVTIKNIKPGTPWCTATYNAETLEVAGTGETITWHATGGWDFASNGIEIASGNSQFSGAQAAGNKFTMVDANSDETKYKYVVHLVKGKEKCAMDPSIANGAETIDPNYPPQ